MWDDGTCTKASIGTWVGTGKVDVDRRLRACGISVHIHTCAMRKKGCKAYFDNSIVTEATNTTFDMPNKHLVSYAADMCMLSRHQVMTFSALAGQRELLTVTQWARYWCMCSIKPGSMLSMTARGWRFAAKTLLLHPTQDRTSPQQCTLHAPQSSTLLPPHRRTTYQTFPSTVPQTQSEDSSSSAHSVDRCKCSPRESKCTPTNRRT